MDKSILLEKFTTIGINHHQADVEVRERFSLSSQEQRELLLDAKRQGIPGVMVISTCNRTEIFARTSDAELLSILLVKHSRGMMEEFREFGFIRHGEAAVKHFFRVAVGLEAQILGDLQIIKQVKESYQLSVDCDCVDSVMHRFMQSITRTHKRSRTETSLGMGAATTAYAAVQMAKTELKSFRDKKVLLIGAGKIGKVTCKNLISLGATDVTVINRNTNRAEELGGRFQIKVGDIDRLDVELAKADLVIVATGAPLPIILKKHFELADPEGGQKLIIDLAVPRNVSPDVESFKFIKLINMDMLSDALDETLRERQANIPLVEQIISEEFEQFCIWLSELSVVPTIRALNDKFDEIRKTELARFQYKMDEEVLAHMDNLTRRIVNKIVAHSIEHLKENQGRNAEVTRVIQDMYKIAPEPKS
jgi:glutamyl-tRNA reductase